MRNFLMLTAAEFGEVAVAVVGIGITGAEDFQDLLALGRQDAHLSRSVQLADGIDIILVVFHIPGAVAAEVADIEGFIPRRSGRQDLLGRAGIGVIVAPCPVEVLV